MQFPDENSSTESVQIDFNYSVQFKNHTVADISRAYNLLSSLSGKKSEAFLIFGKGDKSYNMNITPLDLNDEVLEPNKRLFEDLVQLQEYLGQELIIPKDNISDQDLSIIDELVKLFTEKKIEEYSPEISLSYQTKSERIINDL